MLAVERDCKGLKFCLRIRALVGQHHYLSNIHCEELFQILIFQRKLVQKKRLTFCSELLFKAPFFMFISNKNTLSCNLNNDCQIIRDICDECPIRRRLKRKILKDFLLVLASSCTCVIFHQWLFNLLFCSYYNLFVLFWSFFLLNVDFKGYLDFLTVASSSTMVGRIPRCYQRRHYRLKQPKLYM